MRDEVKLTVLWIEDFTCSGGTFPEMMVLKASRPLTEVDKEELEALVEAEIEKAMAGCRDVKKAKDREYDVDVIRADPTIMRLHIVCPFKTLLRHLTAEAALEELLLHALGGGAVDEMSFPEIPMVPMD